MTYPNITSSPVKSWWKIPLHHPLQFPFMPITMGVPLSQLLPRIHLHHSKKISFPTTEPSHCSLIQIISLLSQNNPLCLPKAFPITDHDPYFLNSTSTIPTIPSVCAANKNNRKVYWVRMYTRKLAWMQTITTTKKVSPKPHPPYVSL